MKKLVALLLCVITLMTASVVALAEDTFTVGFCNYQNSSPFPAKIWKQMEMQTGEKGWKLDVTESLGDSETFMQCVDNYIMKGVDVIVAYWVDTAIAQNVQQICDEAGIPFIIMGCEPENQLVVSANNKEFGRMVGAAVAEAAIEKWDGKIDSILMVESARNGELNTIRMSNAEQAVLDTLGITADDVEIEYVDGEMDQVTAQQNVTNAFTAHPNWERTLIVCFEEEFTFAGTLPAVIAEGKEDQVLVAEIQGYTELLYYAIEDYDWVVGGGEHFSASFVSAIIDLCEQIEAGTIPEPGIYDVPLTFLNRDNYQQYSYLD